jgi:hypothetical protein
VRPRSLARSYATASTSRATRDSSRRARISRSSAARC